MVYPDISAQVNYETITTNPDTGEEIVNDFPNVAIRRSSLARIPGVGETWHVKMPVSPLAGAPLVDFISSEVRPPEGGATLGIIRLYLTRLSQV